MKWLFLTEKLWELCLQIRLLTKVEWIKFFSRDGYNTFLSLWLHHHQPSICWCPSALGFVIIRENPYPSDVPPASHSCTHCRGARFFWFMWAGGSIPKHHYVILFCNRVEEQRKQNYVSPKELRIQRNSCQNEPGRNQKGCKWCVYLGELWQVFCAKRIDGCSYFSGRQFNLSEQSEGIQFCIRGFAKGARCNTPEHEFHVMSIARIPFPRRQ